MLVAAFVEKCGARSAFCSPARRERPTRVRDALYQRIGALIRWPLPIASVVAFSGLPSARLFLRNP